MPRHRQPGPATDAPRPPYLPPPRHRAETSAVRAALDVGQRFLQAVQSGPIPVGRGSLQPSWLEQRETGATAVEYGMMVAAIAAVLVGVVFGFGQVARGSFQTGCDSIGPALHDTTSCPKPAPKPPPLIPAPVT